MAMVRYVAIGDSFTEGVGDELPDGRVRGWADLVAQGYADGTREPVEYANLAVRGRLIRPIIEEQLDAALALAPTHLSFNGGGNDLLRPRADLRRISGGYLEVLRRCAAAGVTPILLSGANPSDHLPLGPVFDRRGDALTVAVKRRLAAHEEVPLVLNWSDRGLRSARFWSRDRLHMNARGHHRVAARVLGALGVTAPEDWWDLPGEAMPVARGWGYYQQYVGPWIHRRLTGTSSGDGRAAKLPDWVTIPPRG